MKWMYIFLIVVVIGVAFIIYTNFSIYIDLTDPNNRGISPLNLNRLNYLISINFAKATSILEVIAIIIGILGFKNLKKTSLIIILTSLPMLFWSYLMYQKPTHISVDEVILAWIIYMIGILALAIIGFRNYEEKIPEMEWDENILDDGV